MCCFFEPLPICIKKERVWVPPILRPKRRPRSPAVCTPPGTQAWLNLGRSQPRSSKYLAFISTNQTECDRAEDPCLPIPPRSVRRRGGAWDTEGSIRLAWALQASASLSGKCLFPLRPAKARCWRDCFRAFGKTCFWRGVASCLFRLVSSDGTALAHLHTSALVLMGL